MFETALKFTRDMLDQHLKNRFGLDESVVLLNNIIDTNGNIPMENQNMVVVSLINIEKETNKPFYNRPKKVANGSFQDLSPSEKYNLDLLVSTNFDEYQETLKFLGAIVQFFQVNLCLDAGSSSAIPPGVNRLEFDIEKISYHQMHSLWTAFGAKYQPSVIYKMRLITIQGFESQSFIPQITQYASPVNP